MSTKLLPFTTTKRGSGKATFVLVGFVFVFLVTSVAIGLRTSNAALPLQAAKGCHTGGGSEGDGLMASVKCTSTTISSTSTTVTTTVTNTVSTDSSTSISQGPSDPVTPVSTADCGALKGISYQALATGTNLTIAYNGNGQMTFTVPKTSFTWMWYFVPANGQNTATLGQTITSAMWANGHGQNFSFFVASLNGQTGLVLQTDYALSQVCG
jgi:hypothetical protein